MLRRSKPSRSPHLAFEFTGDEAAEAKASLQHSARRRKRKRSVLGLSCLTPSPDNDETTPHKDDFDVDGALDIQPEKKRRRKGGPTKRRGRAKKSVTAKPKDEVGSAGREGERDTTSPKNVIHNSAGAGEGAKEYVPQGGEGVDDPAMSATRRSPRTPRPSAKARGGGVATRLRLRARGGKEGGRRERAAREMEEGTPKRPRRARGKEGGACERVGEEPSRGREAAADTVGEWRRASTGEKARSAQPLDSNDTAMEDGLRQESHEDSVFTSPVRRRERPAAADDAERRTPQAAKASEVTGSSIRTPVKLRIREPGSTPRSADAREKGAIEADPGILEAQEGKEAGGEQVGTPVRLRIGGEQEPVLDDEGELDFEGPVSPVEDRVEVQVWDPEVEAADAEDEAQVPVAEADQLTTNPLQERQPDFAELKQGTELPAVEVEKQDTVLTREHQPTPAETKEGTKGTVAEVEDLASVQIRETELAQESGDARGEAGQSAPGVRGPLDQVESPTNSRSREYSSVLPASQRRFAPIKEEESGQNEPQKGDESSAARNPPTFAKRVRFSEPQESHRPVKLGLLGFMRLKRNRSSISRTRDVAVVTSGPAGPDAKGRQVLLDELQYLLDGVFKSVEKKNRTSMTIQLVKSSLQALVELLLRKAKKPVSRPESQPETDCGVVLQILATQPQMLKKILTGLFGVLGISRLVDVLLSLVFVVIFRSTSHTLLLEESFVDLLIQGFLRNSGSSLSDEQGTQRKSGEAQSSTGTQAGSRRRGKLSQRLSDSNKHTAFICSVNELVKEAGIKDENFKGFKNESDGSAYLMGVALGMLLEGQEKAREWMRENRRLDVVVAVLYSCEKVLLAKSKPRDSDGTWSKLEAKDIEEQCTISIVMGAAMRILEFATIDQTCQLRVATESNVGRVILDLVHLVTEVDGGVLAADSLVCHALRLSINLTHDCKHGTQQFVKLGGPQVIIDCIAQEGLSAGLIEGPEHEGPHEERFDVRVLCLALLASVLDEEDEVREGFSRLHACGIPKREGGAIILVLELLKNVGKKKKEKNKGKGTGDEMADLKTSDKVELSTLHEGGDPSKACTAEMEHKITVGYLCLLVGALAHKCDLNREMIRGAMPEQSLLGVAAVLDEFLDFHHEVGVTSVAMDEMYKSIIATLVEEAQLPISSLFQLRGAEKGKVSDQDVKKDAGDDVQAMALNGDGEAMGVEDKNEVDVENDTEGMGVAGNAKQGNGADEANS